MASVFQSVLLLRLRIPLFVNGFRYCRSWQCDCLYLEHGNATEPELPKCSTELTSIGFREEDEDHERSVRATRFVARTVSRGASCSRRNGRAAFARRGVNRADIGRGVPGP